MLGGENEMELCDPRATEMMMLCGKACGCEMQMPPAFVYTPEVRMSD